ncbi:universal stress protein [Formosa sp. S-31]|uniref:universal stress protein n=1 Tax=Formosa sp. S-31 TaxID=2790949 RepID=UPI003EB7832A
MKRILLPTDFSDNAWNAIAYAMQLFKNDICTFFLLHTYTPIVYDAGYSFIVSNQFGLLDVVKENAMKDLKATKSKIEDEYHNPNHIIEIISSFNALIPEISDIVDFRGIDYVVMGTKGASGVNEVLFGSNTVHVIKNIKCPVLAVPEGYNFETPEHILFPTDYEIDYKDDQMQPITDIVASHEASLHVMNASFGYDLSEKQRNNKSKLKTYFANLKHKFHSVSGQNVQEAINNFQTETPVQLLVMIKNKHTFFESLFFKSRINQIGFHLVTPFLVLPQSKLKN